MPDEYLGAVLKLDQPGLQPLLVRVLAGALRLLADWGSRVSRESEPLRHAACGTPVEARWYCPTCARAVEGPETEEIRHV